MKASEQGCRILRGAWRCSEFNVEYNSILRRIQAGNIGFTVIFLYFCVETIMRKKGLRQTFFRIAALFICRHCTDCAARRALFGDSAIRTAV